MSGGYYDYAYFKLEQLADEIEKDFLNDGKSISEYDNSEYDHLNDATEEERPIILNEIKNLVIDLHKCSKRARHLEWLMSGDDSPSDYLEVMKEENLL